jgi:hypothetical protein
MQIILTSAPNGKWYIDQSNGENVWPRILFKDNLDVAARVLQLLDIKEPVKPQDYPIRVCIGEIETDDSE